MVNSVEYITPAVQENTNTAHLVLARAKHTIPRRKGTVRADEGRDYDMLQHYPGMVGWVNIWTGEYSITSSILPAE